MIRPIILPLTGILSLAFFASIGADEKKAKEEPLAVIDTGTELKIVKKSEVEDLQKKADAKFEESMKAFNEAKKQAARANRPFNKPQPQKVKINILGTFKSEVEAKTFLEKAQEKKNASDPFAVLEVGEEFKFMRKSAIAGYEKSLDKKYQAELKNYNEAKKSAEKKGQKFTGEKPVKPNVKVLNATFKTQAEAKAYSQKAQAEKNSKGKAK